jgi:hypothetical protein
MACTNPTPTPTPPTPSFELTRYELQDPGMQEMLSRPGAIKGGYLLIEPLTHKERWGGWALGALTGRWGAIKGGATCS